MSEYTEGKARVNGTTVELSQGADTLNTNVKAGDLFRFQGDTPGYYFVASVTDEQHFELTAPYAGIRDQDVDYDYLIVRDFTGTLKLALMEAGDVDIREIFSYNMAILDTFFGGDTQVPSEFAQGARMIFDQDTPPTGWSRELDAAIDDRVIRLVTGARQDGGTWTMSGQVMGAHSHSLTVLGGYEGGTGGPDAVYAFQTGVASASIESTDDWRPLHRDCIVGCKD